MRHTKTLVLLAALPFAAFFAAHAGAGTSTPVPLSASRPAQVAAATGLAQARVRADLALARQSVVGGVPTVVAARAAWGVQEQGRHACRISLGYTRKGVAIVLDVTDYRGKDCVAAMAAAAQATQALGKALP